MKIGFITLVMALSLNPALFAGENLLKNGNLQVGEGQKVTNWKLGVKTAGISNDTQNVPDGVTKSLKIDVKEITKNDGYLSQAIYLKDGGSQAFKVSCYMRSSSPRCGYLQVKLIKNKKELKRITVDYSKKDWGKYSKSFNSEGADKILVLCRWRQYDRYQNTSIWFADIKLDKIAKTLAVVGDSTVQNYEASSSKRGWGQMLPELIKEDVAVYNHAAGGKSTKTFRSEGRWQKVLDGKPNFVLIQFGHNDSHAKGRLESTVANGEYKDLLKLYVKEARDAGITPILVTPPHRRVFKGKKMGTVLKPYAENMKAVAVEMSVPCIDLYTFSEEKMTPLGQDGCIPLFCSRKDRSHYSAKGAGMLAAKIAEDLKKDEKTKSLVK